MNGRDVLLKVRMSRPIFYFLSFLVFSGFSYLDDVARRVEEGNQAFGRAEFDAALEAYRSAQTDRPDSAELHYNVGDALYKQGAIDEALAAFQKAVETGNASLGANAFYNIGNALYKKQAFDQAVAAYEKSLELNPGDMDAKINLEMALEKMQEQKKQDDKDKSDENKENDKDQESDSDDQKSDEEKENEEQNEEQKDQDQKDEQQNQNPEDSQDQQQQEGQQLPGELSPEEAERLLDALKDRETESQKRRRIKLQGKRYRGNPW